MNHTYGQRMIGATLALGLAFAMPAAAQQENGGAPGEWLMQYAGARTHGLGGAFVANADDALGILWNPAGLTLMDQNQVMFENVRLFEDTSINGVSFAVPGSWLPSFGVSMLSLGSTGFQRTNEMNDPLGNFDERETAYLFTLAKGFTPRFSLGTNIKLVRQTVEDFSGGGVGFDLGGTFQLTPTLRVGASALNLGGPSVTLRNTPEPWPMQIRGGAAANLFGGRGLVSAEVDQSQGLGTRLHVGAEYWVIPGMALRVGLDDSYAAGGFSYRFGPQYQIDYGVSDHVLGMTHRVGLSYRFGGFFASSKAEPAVFSPTGERATTQILLNAHTKASAESWSLELLNKTDMVVRRFGGSGLPPAHLQWDGKDETGLPLADGAYRYQLVVKDKDGRVVRGSTRVVEIATGGPQGTVPVVTTPQP